MLKILIPEQNCFFRIAADTFAGLWEQVTGERPGICTSDDGASDLVVLGSDAVNGFTHGKIIEKVIPQFALRRDSDTYVLRSATETGGRRLLFLAGGRSRAILYAVYRYFELSAGCRYFWDGDVIPHHESLRLEGFDLEESPRFLYRGLRYFAHRSLNRFQAEHWDFPEWKREIDWILKKRLNLFMLRIGLDDVFQKAFPEIVHYPEGYEVPEATPRSYDDRTLFWKLEYRGELRKKVLAYARERDLLHPEDVGTMTHWYSRTPYEYLDKVKPDFMPQATAGYGQPTGLVWDIRQEKNLDAYWKLTEAHIREYGAPAMFHTIGLAERQCYKDRPSNHQMKLYAYRRIQQKLREHYPHAPLLLGTWDFSMYWKPEEVRDLVKELNPENTLVFDYTSDTDDELRTFQNWDLCGKFPWIYGIFQAYEPNNEPRGNYEAIERRLPIAVEDPMCKGLVLWPENSHADTLMLEYMAANAWAPTKEHIAIDSFVETFCGDRYGESLREVMLKIWRGCLPLIKIRYWRGPSFERPDRYLVDLFSEICFKPRMYLLDNSRERVDQAHFYHKRLPTLISAVPQLLNDLAALPLDDSRAFVVRDAIDLVRVLVSKVLWDSYCRVQILFERWRAGEDTSAQVEALLTGIRDLEVTFAEVLGGHEDYSLYASLIDLQTKHECNPKFEPTLKGNAYNGYCRTYVTELFTHAYIPELDICIEAYRNAFKEGHPQLEMDWSAYQPRFEAATEAFYATPLATMAPDIPRLFGQLPGNLERLASLCATLLEC